MVKSSFIFLLLFLMLFQHSSYSQQSSVDSLKAALKTAKHDTTRCIILNELAETANENEWMGFNEQLKKLSENNLAINKNLALDFFYTKHFANALNNCGTLYQDEGNVAKALESYTRALMLQQKIKYKKGIAASQNNIGYLYNSQGNLVKALECYEKSLQLHQELKDKAGISATLVNIGYIYNNRGDILKALQYYQRALKIQEETNDKAGMASSLLNLGYVYSNQEDFSKALEAYTKALKLYEEMPDKYGMATALNNIGTLYQKQNEITKALEYFNRALILQREIEDKLGTASSLNNIGTIYSKQGDKPKAIEYYNSSLKIREEINDRQGMANSLISISMVMFETGKINDAENFALHCMKIARELGYPDNIKSAASVLKSIYSFKKNYKSALTMYELEIQMRDSISNRETKKAAIKTQLKYEYEKKNAADSVKNAEQQKVKDAQIHAQNATLKQEKFQRYSLVAGLLIVLVGLGFVVNRFRVTSKQKKTIEAQKLKVDEAFEKLREKNKEVLDSIYYARRIQRALITGENYVHKNLKRLKPQ